MIAGASDLRQFEVRVSSKGSGPFDGWVRVADFDASKFDPIEHSAGLANITIVAWAQLGGVVLRSNQNLRAGIELGLGHHSNPNTIVYRTIARFGLDHWRVEAGLSMPCFWVWHQNASAGGAWPTDQRPALWARIATEGGPTGLTDADFGVTNVGWLAFYHAGLDARVLSAGSSAQTILAPATETEILNTGALGSTVVPGTGRYLGFVSISQRARFNPTTPDLVRYRCREMQPDGTTVVRNLFGRGARWGQVPSGRSGTLGDVRIQSGGMFTVDDPDAANSIRLYARDSNLQATDTSVIVGQNLFLLHVENLGDFASSQLELPTTSGADIFNDHDIVGDPNRILLEQTRRFPSDTVALGCGAYFPDGGIARTHHLRIGLSDNAVVQPARYTATQIAQEAIHQMVGREDEALGTGAFRHELAGWQAPWQQGEGLRRRGTDLCLAAWSWENDPQYQPTPALEPPPPSYITPSRESLGTGSLLDLPIQPSAFYSVEPDTTLRHEIVGLDRSRTTWPNYLLLRDTLRIDWRGLSEPEREQLRDFLATNRTFRWTRPDTGSVVALTVDGMPRFTPHSGRKWACSVIVLQLVWTGGGP